MVATRSLATCRFYSGVGSGVGSLRSTCGGKRKFTRGTRNAFLECYSRANSHYSGLKMMLKPHATGSASGSWKCPILGGAISGNQEAGAKLKCDTLTRAGSTGRCNTGLKFIRRGLKSQCLSRTLIQSERDPTSVSDGTDRYPWEVLSQ